ncbi:flagellar basal body-associated FliL family protein [Desulfomicrobium salsuginis]
MILLVLLAQPLQNGDTNVALDDERLRDEVPKGLQKVELDLDDALFLEFEEKEEEPPPPPAEQEPEQTVPALAPQELTAPKRSRKKILIFGLAAALCLLFGAGGAYFFMKSSSDEPTKQPAEAEEPRQQTEAAPHPQPEASSPEADNATKQPPVLVTHSLERFQVEFALADQIRILTFTLSIPNVTEIMRLEMQVKSVFIRDGIYGYLKSAPLSFLDNPANSDKLKSDLAAVINRHMKSGTVSEILIEEYVVR